MKNTTIKTQKRSKCLKKKALLVGINDYESIRDLKGCHNDVTNYRSILLNYFGFTNKDIRVLIDDRATAYSIQERMEWLKKDMDIGDKIFFQFSGHGSQIRDRDNETEELADGKDEILCCWGMDWDSGYIVDDYINNWLYQVKRGVTVDMVLDCCHSGVGAPTTDFQPADFIAQTLGPFTPYEESKDVRSRYLPPPLDIELRSMDEDLYVKRIGVNNFDARVSFLTEQTKVVPKHAIWSGCGESQTSADAMIRGSYNGAFSYYFCKHVRESGGKLSRIDLLTRVKDSVKHHGYTQIPELTCNSVYDSNLLLS